MNRLGLGAANPMHRTIHSKNAGMFQTKFGSNMDKPKCWIKNVIKKKMSFENES